MEVNFQEFISNKNFNFIHEGPIEIIINSNKEKINSFVETLKAVYIDSSINGILKCREFKKNTSYKFRTKSEKKEI